MPLYDYRNCITGQTEEHFRHWRERDNVPPHLTRIEVPNRIYVSHGVRNPEDVAVGVPAGLRSMEEHGDSQTFDRLEAETGFSKEQFKEAWKPENDVPEEPDYK